MSARVSPHDPIAMHSCVASSTAHTYKRIMKTFLPSTRTFTVNTSRRRFIVGSAAVAGSGLALGLPAAWSLSVDALRPKTVDAIKQTTFTSEDVKLIQSCFEQGWREGWYVPDIRENPYGWLVTTPIAPHLASKVWEFFVDTPDPAVTGYGLCFDMLFEFIGNGGRVADVSESAHQSYLSTEDIVDRVRSIWEYANRSEPINATDTGLIVVSAQSEKRCGDRHQYLYESLDTVLAADCYWFLESPIEEGETASVCLWIEEETR